MKNNVKDSDSKIEYVDKIRIQVTLENEIVLIYKEWEDCVRKNTGIIKIPCYFLFGRKHIDICFIKLSSSRDTAGEFGFCDYIQLNDEHHLYL